MKNRSKMVIKTLLGTNAATLIQLLRLGPDGFLRSTCSACESAWHTESNLLAHIPVVSLADILGANEPLIELSIRPQEDGSLPTEQALVLASIIRAEHPAVALEIGTYMGHTTRLMAENARDATIHTVDLPPDFDFENEFETTMKKDDFHLINSRIVGREFKGRPCERRIQQHFGDTATWDFEEAARASFFFIDGSHTYEYVKNDSEKCLELCRGDGVFLWHDCDDTHPGVLEFLNEWRESGRDIRRIAGTPLAYWKTPDTPPLSTPDTIRNNGRH